MKNSLENWIISATNLKKLTKSILLFLEEKVGFHKGAFEDIDFDKIGKVEANYEVELLRLLQLIVFLCFQSEINEEFAQTCVSTVLGLDRNVQTVMMGIVTEVLFCCFLISR